MRPRRSSPSVKRVRSSLVLVTGGEAASTSESVALLAGYHQDLILRRLAAATVRVRLLVAGQIARAYDPVTITKEQLRHIEGDWARLSRQTHASYTQHARDFFAWLVRTGQRGDDPSVVLNRPRVPRGVPHPIDEDDLELALQCAPSERDRTWIVLGAYAGLRCAEIAGLDRSDVLLGDEPALRVRGKGGTERIVPIGQGVVAALHRARMPMSGPLFRRHSGRPALGSTVSNRLSELFSKLGIPASAHSLRHRYASRIYQQTRDLRLVQELLGHESPRTTAVYTAFSTPGARQAVDVLDEGLSAA